MGRYSWLIGILVGFAGTAQAQSVIEPMIDCVGEGRLIGAPAGLISMDDEIVQIAQDAGLEDEAISPEAFCADHSGMVAFILPVPKVIGGAPPVDPNLPDVGAGPEGPLPGFEPAKGTYDMSPGKPRSHNSDDAPIESPPLEDDAAPPVAVAAPPMAAEEPAPSPSRTADPVPLSTVGGSGGCAVGTDPAPSGAFLGFLIVLALVRRRGGAR